MSFGIEMMELCAECLCHMNSELLEERTGELHTLY